MNAIDLFCGCGGMSQGFKDAGFNVLLGVDNNEAALRTYQYNLGGAKTLNADLSDRKTFEIIKEQIDNVPVDLIIAGPPCQGFSLTGPRNFDDERNRLYLAVFEVVKEFLPRAFVIENVNGMATLYGGQIKNEIIRRFAALGYIVNCEVLCAADYGVPQMRKRLFFVGTKPCYGKFNFPIPILNSLEYVSCREAIDDLPALTDDLGSEESSYVQEPRTDYQKKMRGSCNVLHNHVATKHTEYVKSVIAQVPEGGNYKDLPKGVGTSRNFHEAWTRYDGNRPARTIDTGHRNHFHYEYNRVPTIRENARFQSFPDDFVFLGNRTQQNHQVGNAVPPLLGYSIGKSLYAVIQNE